MQKKSCKSTAPFFAHPCRHLLLLLQHRLHQLRRIESGSTGRLRVISYDRIAATLGRTNDVVYLVTICYSDSENAPWPLYSTRPDSAGMGYEAGRNLKKQRTISLRDRRRELSECTLDVSSTDRKPGSEKEVIHSHCRVTCTQ